MAGHSQFANIKHRKDAQDRKKAGKFTKVVRQIVVASKEGGPNVDFNPSLRVAIIAARAINVPKDKIEAAIRKGSGEDTGENYEEIRYEGYAPGGIALIVEALTENRNRTAADVRSAFTKFGGNMGETGSVNFLFDRVGLIEYDVSVAGDDAMFEAALEAGATNCETNDYMHEIICKPEDFSAVRDGLSAKFGDAKAARLSWIAKEKIPVDSLEKAEKLLKLIDVLEDNDDVQTVEGNFEISEDIAQKINV